MSWTRARHLVRLTMFSVPIISIAGCASGPPPEKQEGTPLAFELYQPEIPALADTTAVPLQAVAETREEWSDAWTDLFGQTQSPPDVDFASWRVAVIALATQPTGGIVVAVDQVVETNTMVQVQAVETVPGPDCMTIQALTRPVSLTLLPRSPKPVQFFVERREERCGAG